MSRHEHENIEKAITKVYNKKRSESIDITELTYNNNGKLGLFTIESEITAKSRSNPNTKRTTYYIKMCGGQCYNPQKEYDYGYSKLRWSLRSVKRPVFDTYIKFLETKRETYLRQVERQL